MGRRLATAVLVALLVVPAGAGAGVSPSQLALIPLPKPELGVSAVSLPLDPDSGVHTNKDAASDAFGNVKAAQLTRLGRLTGYVLDYSDSSGKALRTKHGLLEVETGVEQYRDAAAASNGLAFWRRDEQSFVHAPVAGIKVSFAPFVARGVSGNPYTFAGSIEIKGKPKIYGAEVMFQVDDLLADVSVTAADATEATPLAVSLARKLQARVALARAGKLAGPPVPLPGKVKPGPPPGGPDLSKLALVPADLRAGTVKQQGYRLDKDLSPISDYERELAPAGPFADLEEQVELFHSSTEASYTLAAVTAGLSSQGLIARYGASDFKSAHIASFSVRRLPAFHAGDEARAVLATVRLTNGATFNMGFVVVRTGSVVETLTATVSVGTRLLPSALADLARIAAHRADRGLHPAGSA